MTQPRVTVALLSTIFRTRTRLFVFNFRRFLVFSFLIRRFRERFSKGFVYEKEVGENAGSGSLILLRFRDLDFLAFGFFGVRRVRFECRFTRFLPARLLLYRLESAHWIRVFLITNSIESGFCCKHDSGFVLYCLFRVLFLFVFGSESIRLNPLFGNRLFLKNNCFFFKLFKEV